MRIASGLAVVIGLAGTACEAERESPAIRYTSDAVNEATPFVPGTISSEHNEFDLALTPDGKGLYFTRRVEGEPQKVLYSEFDGTNWSEPVLAPFSTDRDETPAVNPDGRFLHFGSQREIPGRPNLGGFDMNVWRVERIEDGWSEPEPLPEPINLVQKEGENWPVAGNNLFSTVDGVTYYFTSMYPGAGAIELYATDFDGSTYSEPRRIDGLFEEEGVWIYSAFLSPDGDYLLFNSYDAPGGTGGEDIFVSKKTATGWSQAVNIGPAVNTAGEESSPRFSPDGRYFFFTHADKFGEDDYSDWDIYFLETRYLGLETLWSTTPSAQHGESD